MFKRLASVLCTLLVTALASAVPSGAATDLPGARTHVDPAAQVDQPAHAKGCKNARAARRGQHGTRKSCSR